MDLLCKARLLSWASSFHPHFCYWGVYFHWYISSQLGLSLHQGLPGAQQRPADQAVFPEGQLLRVQCSLPGLCTGMQRLEEISDGGFPLAPSRESPFPSPQPLGVSRAIPENCGFEQKGFLSATANVLVSQGCGTDISPLPAFAGSSPGRCTSTAFLLQTKPRGEVPSLSLWSALAPAAVGPWVAGRGPGSAPGPGGCCSGTPLRPRRRRAAALLWKPGKYPRKYVGAGLGAEVGNPPVGAGWGAGLSPRVCAVPSPPGCCPSAFFIAVINRG